MQIVAVCWIAKYAFIVQLIVVVAPCIQIAVPCRPSLIEETDGHLQTVSRLVSHASMTRRTHELLKTVQLASLTA